MNQTDLQILLQLKDEASAEFKKAGESMAKTANGVSEEAKKAGSSFSNMGKIIGGVAVAGGAAIGAFLLSSVKAAAEAEKSMARVTATLKSMGDAALKNKDAVLAAADAAIKLGFDDEDAAESITRLYQRTNDLTKATQLNNLAMDIARARDIDLATASNAVLAALNGQEGSLTRLKFTVDSSLPVWEQLMQVQKQVQGQAEDASKTWAVQMEILGIQFTNIKETVGVALIDALMPFIKTMVEWLSNPKVKEDLVNIVTSFAKFAQIVGGALYSAWKSAVEVMTSVWEIVFKIADGMESIIEKSKQFGKTLKDSFKNAGSNIKWAIGLEGRASGGPVSSNTPYMVGERGPELFVPSQSGTIVPNGSIGGGGGVYVSLNGNFYGTDQSTAEKFADMIAEMIGQNMKLRTI